MARALHLAGEVLGTVSPNPAVGAVIVRDGQVVGEGATRPPGQEHAEVVALGQAGELACGSALYVTLEPCSHHGRTPPCAEAIIRAGVSRVYAATIDPSPWVNGGGKAALERAGVEFTFGGYEREARLLNEAYIRWVTHHRPHVTAVYGLGLDGAVTSVGTLEVEASVAAELVRLRARADRVVAGGDHGLQDAPSLVSLGAHGVTSLLVECDHHDLRRLAEAGAIDKIVAFLPPRFGGAAANGPAHGSTVGLRDVTYERLGDTLMIVGYPATCSPAS